MKIIIKSKADLFVIVTYLISRSGPEEKLFIERKAIRLGNLKNLHYM